MYWQVNQPTEQEDTLSTPADCLRGRQTENDLSTNATSAKADAERNTSSATGDAKSEVDTGRAVKDEQALHKRIRETASDQGS